MAKDILKTVTSGKHKTTIQWIIIAVVVTIIIYFIYAAYQASKTAGSAAGQIAGSAIIAQQTGISSDRQLICKQAATDCYGACTFIPFTSVCFWLSESPIVAALNNLTTSNEAVLTAQYFREQAGTSLKNIVTNSLLFSGTSLAKINTTILNSLT